MSGTPTNHSESLLSAPSVARHGRPLAILDQSLAPLFWQPERLGAVSSWWTHVPFGHWIVHETKPRVLVELGTHNGVSYSAFCEAVQQAGLATRCHAVDTWRGDVHSGEYGEEVYRQFRRFHDEHFGAFSTLLRCTFDAALERFRDHSIDLLHIDGLHTFEAVQHDFQSWSSKLSEQAIVLFHDTNERRDDFGVWRLWEELRERYPVFEFLHGHGLGVVAVGKLAPQGAIDLCALSDPHEVALVRGRFAALGERWRCDAELRMLELSARQEIEAATARVEEARSETEHVRLDARAAIERAGIEARAQLEQARAEARASAQVRADAERSLDAMRLDSEERVARAVAEKARAVAEKERFAQSARVAEQRAQARADAERSLDAMRLDSEERLARAVAEKERLAQSACAADQRAQAAEATASAAAARVSAIENSTCWRVTGPVRLFLERFPKAGRRARRVFQIAWWTVTLQLLRRLRERRTQISIVDPDVAASGMDAALEGREPTSQQLQVRAISASAFFDEDWYLNRYPDVARAGLDAAVHYATRGGIERRSPGPGFDADWYLTTYPDVAATGVNPLLHYIDRGIKEGRQIRRIRGYAEWVREYDTLSDADAIAIRAHIAEFAVRPLISIVVPVYETDERYLREMIESVLEQIYPHWELCIADDASSKPHVATVLEWYRSRDPRVKIVYRGDNGHISAASNSAVELATGELVTLLDHDDRLAPHALYMVALAFNEHPDADVFYSDEDKIDAAGERCDPYFKPDWNPELFCSQNFVNHLGVYRTSLLRTIGSFRVGFEGSQDYDLTLRMIAATTGPIVHIPHVLYHWRIFQGASSYSSIHLESAMAAARRAIVEHLATMGEVVTATSSGGIFHRVIRQEPDCWPRVSIIVPTRDHVDVLEACISGVFETDYPDLELIIVDNESKDDKTRAFFAEAARRGVRILSCSGQFNFSRINNLAAHEATGDVFVFLNNDVSVIHPSWLKEMILQAVRPGVGAVGARLLYPDGTIQHGGVVLGIGGVAGHIHLGAARDDPGYFGRLKLAQDVSCVTAACMAVTREVFEKIGGFDEEHLVVAFNDVDLCIRIRETGYRIIWTPYAELYHWESRSRGSDTVPSQIARFHREGEYIRTRWSTQIASDPFFNPNLSLDSIRPEPAFPPRTRKPWLARQEPGSSRLPVKAADCRTSHSGRHELIASLRRSAHIIEIGPGYNPLFPKADGWNTRTLDHATRAALIEKYRGHPGVDVERIEDVDFVWTSGPMINVVPSELHGMFDAFIASHVIEHTTDFVGFLDAAQTLLADDGVVILVVPDKRYCFDYFRPLTTTGDVLDAHAGRRSRHTRRALFNHVAYVVKNGGVGAWGQGPMQDIEFSHSLEQAAEVFATVREESTAPYTDVHAWQFTPASFELLLLELACLGETDWLVERVTPAAGCEFYAWLRRGGRAAVAAITASQIDKRRLELLKRTLLQVREQTDFLLAGDRRAQPA
jgi:GT2 family glycosyltransferase